MFCFMNIILFFRPKASAEYMNTNKRKVIPYVEKKYEKITIPIT